MNYLEELNAEQLEAVKNYEGPSLIIAGPGSGKTRVLTYKIAYMLENGIDPFNVLALTFTNKASREMKERIHQIIGTEAKNLWMGTFHSVFARILRFEASRLGYPSNFSIYDTQDSKNLCKRIIKELNLNDSLYKVNTVFNRISGVKNSLVTPEEYRKQSHLMQEDEQSGRKRFIEVYETYTKRCFQAGAMDFDDLLLKMYVLIKQFPDALYKYQSMFKYILIDEFQDTNHAQFTIVKMLGDMFENVCVVGDDAQSIYSFRGADIKNILEFEKHYSDLKTYRLEQNYRSTKNIVNLANAIIVNNKNQLQKKIWTQNDEGQLIKVIKSASDNEEGLRVVESIFEEKMRLHLKDDAFAILYRTNAQSRSFEEALRRKNIPYRVYGGISFYQRKEVKDLLAYLKIIVNPNDEESLLRIINYPARGIGKTTIEKITVLADQYNISFGDVLNNIHQFGLPGRATKAIQDFITMIKSFMVLSTKKDAYELAAHVGKSTGILKELYNDKSVEGLSRYENIQELLNSIKEFTVNPAPLAGPESENPNDKSIGGYLQQVTLLTDLDEQDDDVPRVKLMTIHAAKGLEFDVVYIVGLEENLFPSMMSINSRQELEEERRLFYVAITRAMKKLFFTYASTRYRFGSLMYCDPSRFIEESPPELLVFTGRRKPAEPQGHSNKKARGNLLQQFDKYKQASYQHSVSDGFSPDKPVDIQTGMEIEHQRFGFGKVIGIEGRSDNRIANIFFKNVGNKKIMLKYARLSILKNKPLGDE
jgi:ATP-dependent DNA helicase UvrD/PcrA